VGSDFAPDTGPESEGPIPVLACDIGTVVSGFGWATDAAEWADCDAASTDAAALAMQNGSAVC